MRTLFLISLLFGGALGCQTKQKEVLNYGGALAEVYRAGTPLVEPYPNYYHRVSHTCTSTPIYDLHGYYIRTDVRCW